MALFNKHEIVKIPQEEQVIKDVENVVEKELEFTHEAFGIFLGQDGMRYVAKVMYNPFTGETGKFQRIGPGDDRSSVNERFKIEVGRADLMTGSK
jgi:hypothetical protein